MCEQVYILKQLGVLVKVLKIACDTFRMQPSYQFLFFLIGGKTEVENKKIKFKLKSIAEPI